MVATFPASKYAPAVAAKRKTPVVCFPLFVVAASAAVCLCSKLTARRLESTAWVPFLYRPLTVSATAPPERGHKVTCCRVYSV